MSAGRKQSAVLRLLRGEDVELISRELGVMGAELSAWREALLSAGETSFKTWPADGRDLEIGRLEAKVGELTMATELLEANIERLEGGRPWARRRFEAMSGSSRLSTSPSYGVLPVAQVWRLSSDIRNGPHDATKN